MEDQLQRFPPAWLRSTLDAFIVFEAFLQNKIYVYTALPPIEERQALVFHGSIVVWNSTAASVARWADGQSWGGTRKILAYLVYRQEAVVRAPNDLPTTHPDTLLFNDVFCAHRDHDKYIPNSLMKRTISFTLRGEKIMILNYYDPASQLGLGEHEPLPQLSTLSPWSLLTYQIDSALLRPPVPIRQPPVASMLAFLVDGEIKERLVYCGEYGAAKEVQEHHLECAREFWNPPPHTNPTTLLVAHSPLSPSSHASSSPTATETIAATDYFTMLTSTPLLPSIPLRDMAPLPTRASSTPIIIQQPHYISRFASAELLNPTQVPQYTVGQFASPTSSSTSPYYPTTEFAMAATDIQHAIPPGLYYPPFVPSQQQELFYDIGEGSPQGLLQAAQDRLLEGQDVPMTSSPRDNTVFPESTLSGWSASDTH